MKINADLDDGIYIIAIKGLSYAAIKCSLDVPPSDKALQLMWEHAIREVDRLEAEHDDQG